MKKKITFLEIESHIKVCFICFVQIIMSKGTQCGLSELLICGHNVDIKAMGTLTVFVLFVVEFPQQKHWTPLLQVLCLRCHLQ